LIEELNTIETEESKTEEPVMRQSNSSKTNISRLSGNFMKQQTIAPSQEQINQVKLQLVDTLKKQ
jgi:hypothetical protein